MASKPIPDSQHQDHSSIDPVHGVVAVIRHDNRYLIIQRARGLAAGGAWCFPGGAVEPGETSAQVREVAEEVGLKVRPVGQVWQWTHKDGRLVLDWWQVEMLSTAIVPDPAEVADVRWMTAAEIRSMPGALPGLFQFLDRFCPES